MKRQEYLDLCLEQPVTWLKWCAENPSDGMTRLDVATIRYAIVVKRYRNRGLVIFGH